MINLYRLKILIILLWLFYLGYVLSIQIYDPTLYSPILHLEKILVNRTLALNYLFFALLVVESALLLYSSAALWLGRLSGKWTYLLYAALTVADNIFLSVHAYSSIDMIFITLSYMTSGVIVLALFTATLSEELKEKKPFKFWEMFVTFFIFFILFFALPITINYFKS